MLYNLRTTRLYKGRMIMNVITLRDYAKQNNISYEAVRKQVVRYQDELAGHLIRDGRQQFLDDEAVAFLDARRQKNPVAIIQIEKDEKIDQLEHENKILLQELATVQKALLNEKDKIDLLLSEKNAQLALLEADNEAARAEVAKANKVAQEAQEGLVRAQEAYEIDLSKKNEQIEAWEKYYADVEARKKRPFWNKGAKPVPPVALDLQES